MGRHIELLRSQWNGSLPEMDKYRPGEEIDNLSLETIVSAGSKARKAKNILPAHMDNLKIIRDTEGCKWCLYYLWRTIFPTRSNLMYRYRPGNSSLLPLYYIIHPCKLGKRAFLSLFYNLYSFFERRKKSI
jgi:hypothetical protein